MKSFLYISKSCFVQFLNGSNKVNRYLLLLIGSSLFMQANSQTNKLLVMADQYFAAGDYFTAAGLYGQYLHPVVKTKVQSDFPLNIRRSAVVGTGKYKTKTDVLFKQAESYRLANYWTEASVLYRECYAKDSIKYPVALYWNAVCQRSIGNFDKAGESLQQVFSHFSAGNEWYNAALKERQTIQFAEMQMKRPDSIMFRVQKINTAFSDKGVFAPVTINGNQYLFTSTQTEQVKAGTNPYRNRLFRSELSNEELQNPEPLTIESVDSSSNQGAACISPDGNHLYFTQWQKVNGQTLSSIYYSNKTSSGWSKPQMLSTINEQGHNSKQPFCSADGKYLFFASDRTGGKGGFDIWFAPLLQDGKTGEGVNAGVINTTANELAPFYHLATGTLVFSSDRMPGMGGYDLYSSKGLGTDWMAPENMGAPVNSSRDDIYFFAKEEESLLQHAIISSDRGSECCLAAYAVSKAPKKKMIKGVVLDCVSNEPLDSADVILKDASGKTWQTITSVDGKYSFDLSDKARVHQLTVSREKYNDKSAEVIVENVNETNWQTDTLYNATFCLEKKFVLKVENVVTVYFDFDKSVLKDRGIVQLDSIYTIMMENPKYTLQISGYTDGKGSVEYNNKLSDRRAKSCADYLVQKGIDPSRISFASFGACCPVEMELLNGRDNAEGRSKNRRALININKE